MEIGRKKFGKIKIFAVALVFLLAGCAKEDNREQISKMQEAEQDTSEEKQTSASNDKNAGEAADSGRESNDEENNAGNRDKAGNGNNADDGNNADSGSNATDNADDGYDIASIHTPVAETTTVSFQSPYTSRQFTAQYGQASFYTMVKNGSEADYDAALLLPNMDKWSDDKMVRTSYTAPDNDNGTGTYQYALGGSYDSKEDIWNWTEKYVQMLESQYAMTIDSVTTYEGSKWWYLSTGQNEAIQKGKFSNSDMEFFACYDGIGGPFLMIHFPKGISMESKNPEQDGAQTVYENDHAEVSFRMGSGGLEFYEMKGFAQQRTDYVRIGFAPETYQKGTKYSFSELVNEKKKGLSAALAELFVYSEELGGDFATNSFFALDTEEEYYSDAYLEVVQCDGQAVAFYYYLDLSGRNYQKCISEGILTMGREQAAASADSQLSGDNNSSGFEIPDSCSYCHGTKLVKTVCTAACNNGKVTCPTCLGEGHVTSGKTEKSCSRCNGRGWSYCTKCTDGYVYTKCTHCK